MALSTPVTLERWGLSSSCSRNSYNGESVEYKNNNQKRNLGPRGFEECAYDITHAKRVLTGPRAGWYFARGGISTEGSVEAVNSNLKWEQAGYHFLSGSACVDPNWLHDSTPEKNGGDQTQTKTVMTKKDCNGHQYEKCVFLRNYFLYGLPARTIRTTITRETHPDAEPEQHGMIEFKSVFASASSASSASPTTPTTAAEKKRAGGSSPTAASAKVPKLTLPTDAKEVYIYIYIYTYICWCWCLCLCWCWWFQCASPRNKGRHTNTNTSTNTNTKVRSSYQHKHQHKHQHQSKVASCMGDYLSRSASPPRLGPPRPPSHLLARSIYIIYIYTHIYMLVLVFVFVLVLVVLMCVTPKKSSCQHKHQHKHQRQSKHQYQPLSTPTPT